MWAKVWVETDSQNPWTSGFAEGGKCENPRRAWQGRKKRQSRRKKCPGTCRALITSLPFNRAVKPYLMMSMAFHFKNVALPGALMDPFPCFWASSVSKGIQATYSKVSALHRASA